MKKNLGTIDRVIRLVLATILLIYAAWAPSAIALILSLFVYFEAFASWCVVYHFLGINRCPIDKNNQK